MLDFTRLEERAKEKGISITFLCGKVGRAWYYVRDAKKTGSPVPADYIAAWADILDTTPEYLTGATAQKEKPDAIPPEIRILARKTGAIMDEKQKKLLYDILLAAADSFIEGTREEE